MSSEVVQITLTRERATRSILLLEDYAKFARLFADADKAAWAEDFAADIAAQLRAQDVDDE